jgi:hypothetical protein
MYHALARNSARIIKVCARVTGLWALGSGNVYVANQVATN